MIQAMWKQCLLTGYYWSTLPARRRAAARRAGQQSEPVRILFYHRVADEHANGWTISCRRFERQIDWLCQRFEVVSLAEAQSRIEAGRNRKPTACLTFDDGYADNMRFAVPLLLRRRIPFTYFVSTNHVLGGQPFPHDAAAGRPLAPNSLRDLRAMAEAGVEIGGHTRSHADLGASLTADPMQEEIVGCKRELEDAIGADVRYFAFPFGLHANLTASAFGMALEAGYAGVCSAYGGYNFPGDDAFHLRRIHADPELVRFKNWLTVDPRKLRAHRDFEPGNYRGPTAEVSRSGAEAQRNYSTAELMEIVD
jgi:peptidoglycan/xylan/chitin deacetylase (PgdA/CDA1 family)